MIFDTILPLIKKTGSTLTPEAFHHTVNVAFHDIEAGHYDAIHASMWESLQEQISLLVDDVFEKTQPQSKSLRLLDIGSGTGLSTQMLLNTKLGDFISEITLLDTSPNMLREAEKKARNWNKKYTLSNAEVGTLAGQYDVIIVSSVLHHIPDLKQFLEQVSAIQNSGGIFIHLQDPNGDYMDDAEYIRRSETYENELKKTASKKKITNYIPKSVRNSINKFLGRKTYIDYVNDQLLKEKAIKKRMTAEEIWSVTDIHVENLPFSIGSGISMKFLIENLPDYTMANRRSYGFFGGLKSELLPAFQEEEQQLITKNQLNGRNVSAAWIKK